MEWNNLAPKPVVERTISVLKEHGINALYAENGEEARKLFLSILPEGARVMNMTSMTLTAMDLDKEVNESGRYKSIRKKLVGMDRATQNEEMQMLGAAPPWVVGSVHAVTETGELLIASKTGSQLGAYAYGSSHVLWVAGTQKIVRDREHGFKRIYEWCLPHEEERARQAYGTGSSVNKILIVHEEVEKDRLNLILVNEVLGF
jgi:hypothetical protein